MSSSFRPASVEDSVPIRTPATASPTATALPSTDAAACPAPRFSGRQKTRWIVALLLAAHAAMAFSMAWVKGVSFDEAQQLAVGYNIWLNHDYRIEGGNGDLIKRWATLPYLVSRPNFVPATNPFWRNAESYGLGHQFFFSVGNSPESLLRQARAMTVLLGVATGLLVFWCARETFGLRGGFVALIVYCFSPSMLAFAGLVSTDLSISFTLLGSTWCLWRLLHGLTLGRVLASLVFCGLAVLAKPSALVLFPIAAVLVGVKLAGGRALVVPGTQPRAIHSRWRQAGLFAGLALAHAVFAWGAIWAHYGFRYTASPEPGNPALIMRALPPSDEEPPLVRGILDWSRQTHFLPEGFRRGVRWLVHTSDDLRSYLNGEHRLGGSPGFFPSALWAKTPPGILLLFGVAGGTWIVAERLRRRARLAARALPGPGLYALTPFLTLIAVYSTVAMAEDVNLGYRHAMPAVLGLFVLTGAAALAWHRASRARRWAIRGLLACLVLDSLAIRPDYLAYFGPQVGGPSEGHRHLLDSSLDWGMNLPDLKRWLDTHHTEGEQLYLSYFGTDHPDHYGIRSRRLPGYFDWRPRAPYALEPGLYVISASLFHGLHSQAFGPWNKEFERAYQSTLANMQAVERSRLDPVQDMLVRQRATPAEWQREFEFFDQFRFARLCAWLRHRGPPPEQIAYSFFAWRLTYADLNAALLGPPAELHEKAIEPLVPELMERR